MSGKTKTEVRRKLRVLRKELEQGAKAPAHYTVKQAVETWLAQGLKGRAPTSLETYRYLAATHIYPSLGAAKVRVLEAHRDRQQAKFKAAGKAWTQEGLVFPSRVDRVMDASRVRISLRSLLKEAGFSNPGEWTTRELRTSFVSLLSDHGVPIESIARLVGHSGSNTTERVYRKQIRPVITEGAEAMDEIFSRVHATRLSKVPPVSAESD
ncbi:tyrosine-type recombinase/integrase [Streptomyces spororaveus]|uniref:tyrosine-type recombinase/integrase n=1 Tax=Streptomyces spororaveus TaxID=284039 RepID=UPI0036805B11